VTAILKGARWAKGSIILAALSTALAIAVYGVVFGVVAGSTWGSWRAILGSALIYSGSVQFSAAALMSQGGSAGAIILSAVILNARNVVLGAVLRSRVRQGLVGRLGLAFLMDDESFGLAITSAMPAATVVLGSGIVFFVAWVGGTVVGTLAGSGTALLGAASALFPVLFVGLAAISVRGPASVARTVTGGIGTLVLAYAFPPLRGFAPVVAAVLVSVVGDTK
jgi:predicted branched-subunit amino acid permease